MRSNKQLAIFFLWLITLQEGFLAKHVLDSQAIRTFKEDSLNVEVQGKSRQKRKYFI